MENDKVKKYEELNGDERSASEKYWNENQSTVNAFLERVGHDKGPFTQEQRYNLGLMAQGLK